MADNLSFQHWFKAHKKRKKDAKIDKDSRDLYWKWRAGKGAPVYGSPQNPKDVAEDTPVPPPAYDPNSLDQPPVAGTPDAAAPQNQPAAGGAEESFEERLRRLKDM